MQGEFTYRDTKGFELTRVRGEVLDHVFNQYVCMYASYGHEIHADHHHHHSFVSFIIISGTHHRGQLSAAITQLGYGASSHDLSRKMKWTLTLTMLAW